MKYQIFSNNIKKLINEFANGNKKKFAEFIGYTGTGVARWVKGESLPNAKTCLKIKEKCKISSIDWLLTGKEPNENFTQEDFELLKLRQCPIFQEHLKSYKRYIKLQRNADRKAIDLCHLNVQGHLNLFEEEIQRRKAYKTSQAAGTGSPDPEAS